MGCRVQGRSIHWYLVLSWIIPGLFAQAASVFVIFSFAWVDYRSEKNHKLDRLREDTSAIARKMSNELLLADAGRPEPTLMLLRQDYKLNELMLIPGNLDCKMGAGEGFCVGSSERSLWVDRPVPFVSNPQVIRAELSINGLWSRLGDTVLLWALLPWAFFTLIGLVIQKRFLRAKFMEPMRQLVSIGPEQIKISGNWPNEVTELARRLQNTFDDRDAAVGKKLFLVEIAA